VTSRDGAAELLLDLQVPATTLGMDVVHTALADSWASLEIVRPLQQRWRDEFSLAVAEVAANIIQYAHAPDPPLVDFALLLEHTPGYLQARFIDQGIVAILPESSAMPSVNVSYEDLGERGRGLALVQITVDRFEYRRTSNGENIWIIEKYFPL
jgi:anti-sigma regulatory factor (Ser/Thr protein kinase)